jgi:hypothetical protein
VYDHIPLAVITAINRSTLVARICEIARAVAMYCGVTCGTGSCGRHCAASGEREDGTGDGAGLAGAARPSRIGTTGGG